MSVKEVTQPTQIKKVWILLGSDTASVINLNKSSSPGWHYFCRTICWAKSNVFQKTKHRSSSKQARKSNTGHHQQLILKYTHNKREFKRTWNKALLLGIFFFPSKTFQENFLMTFFSLCCHTGNFSNRIYRFPMHPSFLIYSHAIARNQMNPPKKEIRLFMLHCFVKQVPI